MESKDKLEQLEKEIRRLKERLSELEKNVPIKVNLKGPFLKTT